MSVRVPEDMSLPDGEIPLWFGQMSWISRWSWILIAIICFATLIPVLMVITVLIVILVVIDVVTSEYFISNKRIYVKRGLISRQLNDIKIEWITNIFVKQGIFGRVLKYGDIGISTPGEHGGAIGFIGVSDPLGVKAIIEDTLMKYKENQ
jgi:uncharacterized membrane protein YdbT with pleckstrin-like domain